MKKLKLILTSAFIFFTTFSLVKAQTDFENAIASFVDSTELFADNGRRMMLQYIQTRDFEKVAEIYDFLNERTRANNCVVFTFRESMYIAVLTNNWERFLTNAAHFSDRTMRKPFCYRNSDFLLFETLDLAVRDNISQLFENALTADLTLEDKELLELYFYVIENETDETYNRKLRAFKRKYPRSPYNDFVRGHLPFGIFRAGMGFSAGATQIFPQGNLGNYFESAIAFNLAFNCFINNFYSGFQFSAGSLTLNTPLSSSETGYHRDLRQDLRVSYIDVGVPFGYTLIRNNWFQFTPFTFLGWTTLETSFYSQDDDESDFRFLNSFTLGGGLRAELKLITFEHYGEPSNLSLRFDVGYNVPVFHSFKPVGGNVFYLRSALVWWW